LLLALLTPADRTYVEDTVAVGTFQYQSEFTERLKAEGRAEGEARGEARGEAKAVLTFLEARGIPVDEPTRERIRTTTDLDQLNTWIRRATTVDTADELFD
jgi:hypothetical protein